MITHQRRTMEMADVLFGVSMQADGVTKVISQKLDTPCTRGIAAGPRRSKRRAVVGVRGAEWPRLSTC